MNIVALFMTIILFSIFTSYSYIQENLRISLNSSPPTAGPGDEITYEIKCSNADLTAASNVEIKNYLSTAVFFNHFSNNTDVMERTGQAENVFPKIGWSVTAINYNYITSALKSTI